MPRTGQHSHRGGRSYSIQNSGAGRNVGSERKGSQKAKYATSAVSPQLLQVAKDGHRPFKAQKSKSIGNPASHSRPGSHNHK